MEIKAFIKKVNELLEKNELKKVFALLKKALKDGESKKNMLFQLKRQYNSIQETKMYGIADYEQIIREENRMGVNLAGLINDLAKNDFQPNPSQWLDQVNHENDDITNPILILTRTEEMKNIKLFFEQLNFRKVETREYTDKDFDVSSYDLIIFDNQDLPYCNPEKMFHSLDEKKQILIKDRIRDMEYIKINGGKSIIHFGDFLFWVGSNRSIAQAANSRFTLHARSKEMVEFINTYRV